jgi:hypothetical protein
MKLNEQALKDSEEKLLFLVTEEWQGLTPAATYTQQAEAVSRALDSVEYIERAVATGDVVLAHKDIGASVTTQIVSAETMEKLNEYLKSNEAHARLPLSSRRVLPLSDWDVGKRTFERMLVRAEVRASYEQRGLRQPNQALLDSEADAILKRRSAAGDVALSTEVLKGQVSA